MGNGNALSPYKELNIDARAYQRKKYIKPPPGINWLDLKASSLGHCFPREIKNMELMVCKYCRKPKFLIDQTKCEGKKRKTRDA